MRPCFDESQTQRAWLMKTAPIPLQHYWGRYAARGPPDPDSISGNDADDLYFSNAAIRHICSMCVAQNEVPVEGETSEHLAGQSASSSAGSTAYSLTGADKFQQLF